MKLFTGSIASMVVVFLVWAPARANPDSPKTILCSFYPMYIMALNIAGGVPGVKVESMAKPQAGCLHDYQLTPDDMKRLSSAWAFVINGGGMESFMDKAARQQPSLKVIDASKGIELIENHCPGHEELGHGGHDHGHGNNPHVWVSISGAIAQAKNITEGLAVLDPANAATYRAKGGAYVDSLEQLRSAMHQGLSKVASRNIITFHEAFPYFAREFNLTIVAVIEREPGSEPSAGELAQTIKTIKEKKVKALFAEPQYPAKAAQTIARETGTRVYVLDPAVTGPLTPDAYLTIMRANLKVLREALN